MKYVALTALLLLVPAAANAGAIVETTGPIFQSASSSGGGSFSEVDLPIFNPSLGTLTGVSIAITATVAGTVTDYTGTPHVPSLVPAQIGLSFLSGTPILFPTQTIDVESDGITANALADFAATFTPTSLTSFETLNDTYFIPEPDIFIRSLAGGDTEDATNINFDITETLTYTPIPEPGSFAIFLAGVAFLAVLSAARPRRRVPASV